MQNETFQPSSPIGQHLDPVLFVFLGASNLARSYYGLKRCITRCLFPRPVRFVHALGPGRGYISRGGIFNAIYPPILDCGIIEAIRSRRNSNQKVVALITDVGNDIMYGVPADDIISGLDSLFGTLNEFSARVFITSIPVDLKNDVNEFYFRTLRRIFFPNSPVEYHQAAEAVRVINKFMLESPNENLTVIDGMEQYCGMDKIHYSLLKSRQAWTYVAGRLTNPFGADTSPEMRNSELVFSLASNLFRIIFTDMLGIMNKTNETF